MWLFVSEYYIHCMVSNLILQHCHMCLADHYHLITNSLSLKNQQSRPTGQSMILIDQLTAEMWKKSFQTANRATFRDQSYITMKLMFLC